MGPEGQTGGCCQWEEGFLWGRRGQEVLGAEFRKSDEKSWGRGPVRPQECSKDWPLLLDPAALSPWPPGVQGGGSDRVGSPYCQGASVAAQRPGTVIRLSESFWGHASGALTLEVQRSSLLPAPCPHPAQNPSARSLSPPGTPVSLHAALLLPASSHAALGGRGPSGSCLLDASKWVTLSALASTSPGHMEVKVKEDNPSWP